MSVFDPPEAAGQTSDAPCDEWERILKRSRRIRREYGPGVAVVGTETHMEDGAVRRHESVLEHFPACNGVITPPRQALPRTVTTRPREHKATGGRGAHSPPEDTDRPRQCACGCGAPARPGSKYATDRHGNRARVHRHRKRIEDAEAELLQRYPALIHEAAVVAEIAGGSLSAEDGLLWTVFPAAMRAAYAEAA